MVFGLIGENIYEYYLSITPSRHMTFNKSVTQEQIDLIDRFFDSLQLDK